MVPLDAVGAVVVVALHAARLQVEVAVAVVARVPVVDPPFANLVLLRLTVLPWNKKRSRERRWVKQSPSSQSPRQLAPLHHSKVDEFVA